MSLWALIEGNYLQLICIDPNITCIRSSDQTFEGEWFHKCLGKTKALLVIDVEIKKELKREALRSQGQMAAHLGDEGFSSSSIWERDRKKERDRDDCVSRSKTERLHYSTSLVLYSIYHRVDAAVQHYVITVSNTSRALSARGSTAHSNTSYKGKSSGSPLYTVPVRTYTSGPS